MSSIPYNYGSYIDAKVSMTDTGHVSAGKQIQSPASAGSRGLAKTTQFTNDRTQMQMGNSPIAESMVEIRNILNRIDGVNAPVQEDAGEKIANMAQNMTKDQVMSHADELGLTPEEAAEHYEKMQGGAHVQEKQSPYTTDKAGAGYIMANKDKIIQQLYAGGVQSVLDPKDAVKAISDLIPDVTEKEIIDIIKKDNAFAGESAVQEDDMQDMTISDLEAQLGKINDEITFLQIDQKDKESALAALGELRSVLDKYQSQKESTPEDSGELARLKELSGIREDAGLTDEQKKGLEAIAKKYKDREGGNGDMLAYGYLDVSDTGIPTDGYDKEEMEAYAKKIGVDWREWDGEQSEDFLEQSKITDEMIDDLLKILGQNFMNDSKLQFRAMEYLDSLDNNYEPFPEGDEFDIEEDEDFEEVLGPLGFPEDETELFDAEYQGRKVPLNKPMRGDVKKFKVYVKDPKTGNVKKVNFGHGGSSARKAGQKTMKIRKSNPKARKSFRARHNCANPGPRTRARYWSCRKW